MATETQRAWNRRQDRMRSRATGPARLTPAQRDEIRRRAAAGETPQDLALEYGVTASLIRDNYR